MKQKSDWKRITLLRKTSFKKEIKILAGYVGNAEVIRESFSVSLAVPSALWKLKPYASPGLSCQSERAIWVQSGSDKPWQGIP